MKRRNWKREELILAINLYCKTPFGRIHQRNPDIIKLSQLIGRTPGAIAWKMGNFASIDPSLDRKGASNVGKLDIEIWNEFFNNWEQLVVESENLLINLDKQGIVTKIGFNDIIEGREKERTVKTRVNQHFFRQAVLSSYDFRCCITNISIPELLISSHIIPWAKDPQNRLNPRNGLCLNALHDKAFDQGLITILTDFTIMVSPRVKRHYPNSAEKKFISEYNKKRITLPRRFIPDVKFLEYHQNYIFLR